MYVCMCVCVIHSFSFILMVYTFHFSICLDTDPEFEIICLHIETEIGYLLGGQCVHFLTLSLIRSANKWCQ